MLPKVSVIVPIYKVENYLNRCVDSILNQTYKNIEVILVDDGLQISVEKLMIFMRLKILELNQFIKKMVDYQMQEIMG